jgi:gamma-glutamylaminecyclotransferase
LNSPEPTRLFVYGTLKRGLCRHYCLAGERFLGEARTLPRYRLLNLGDYPGLVEAAVGGRPIAGELYAVSPACLERLDRMEGVDVGLYARQAVALQTGEPAEAYFFLLPEEGYPDCGERWD